MPYQFQHWLQKIQNTSEKFGEQIFLNRNFSVAKVEIWFVWNGPIRKKNSLSNWVRPIRNQLQHCKYLRKNEIIAFWLVEFNLKVQRYLSVLVKRLLIGWYKKYDKLSWSENWKLLIHFSIWMQWTCLLIIKEDAVIDWSLIFSRKTWRVGYIDIAKFLMYSVRGFQLLKIDPF